MEQQVLLIVFLFPASDDAELDLAFLNCRGNRKGSCESRPYTWSWDGIFHSPNEQEAKQAKPSDFDNPSGAVLGLMDPRIHSTRGA